MAEALGIASGVAGFISLGITLCQGVITYYTSYKDRSDSVARMYASVEMLNKTFTLLNSAMNDKSLNPNIVTHVEESVDSCRDGLKSLQKKLDKIKQKPNSKLAKVTYPLKESTLVKLIEISNDMQDNLALALNVLQIDATNLTHQKLDTLTGEVFAVSRGMDTLVLYQQDEQTKKIYEWLSPLAGDFEKKQLDMINLPARQDDTGNWLVNTSEFDIWLKNSGKTLLCLGSPGIGKTVLASYVVHFLQQKSLQESSNFGIAYIYCNYKEAERQTLINFLSDLLRQLAAQKPSFKSELEFLLENHNSKKTRPTISELVRLLSTVVEKFTRVFIVIDALDEFFYEHQNDLIAEMLRVKPSIDLLITSRDTLNVEFDPQNMCRLEIQAENEAVRKYLEESITNSTRLKGHIKKQPSLKEKIIKTIVEKAQSMFLLAHLRLKSLETRRSLRDVESALDTLPLSLDNMYDEAIERMSSQNNDDATLARKIISWIFYAFTPLNVQELQQALAVRPGDESFNPNGIIDREDLLSVCAGIVSIQQESDTIGLVHYTAQEYIQRKGEKNFLNRREARTEIAQTCLTFLAFREFGRGIYLRIRDYDFEDPLYYYASTYWADHAQGDPEQDIIDQMSRLYTHETMITTFAPLALILKYHGPSELGQTSLLHIAAASGLAKWVKMLLQAGADINAKDSIKYFQENALHTAVRMGCSEIAQLLIDRGADIEATDDFGYTPLLIAAREENEDLFQLLVGVKADPFSKNSREETALHIVAKNGNVAVMTMLLKLDLCIDARNDMGYTALNCSASHCNEPVMRMLLEAGADIEAKNMAAETPLHAAARTGYLPTLKLLLENDANMEAKNYEDATALFLAGTEPIIRLLLEKGANTEAKNERGETALLEAVKNRVELKVRLLLENGANIEAKDDTSATSLSTAVRLGDERIVQLLLEKNASVEAENDDGETALFEATSDSSEPIMRVLLEKGANIEARNNRGQTPLLKAVELGNKPVIRLLLEKGASTEARNNRGETPILEAARLRDESMVRLLLEKGANIEAKNVDGETALFRASVRGDESVIRLLLEKGINIEHKCNSGRTALFHAALRGEYGAVKLLLENGADIESKNDSNGATALQIAAYYAHLNTIQLLLKNGANPKVKDANGLTALIHATTGKEGRYRKEDYERVIELLNTAVSDS